MFIHYYIIAVAFLLQGTWARVSRIINGDSAHPHQYPHQVALYLNIPPLLQSYYYCGGVIIDEQWILTAGQCIPKVGVLSVKAGKHYLSHDEAGQQDRFVIKSIRHKNYRRPILNKFLARNDIALLKLNEPLTVNEFVKPIALPAISTVHTGTGILTGWGSTSQNVVPQFPTDLQAVKLSIIDNAKCSAAINAAGWGKKLINIVINGNQICTGSIGETYGACIKDTGSAFIQIDENDNKTELVGIVSWSRYPCNKPGVPTVYTKVSEYIDWINANKIEV